MKRLLSPLAILLRPYRACLSVKSSLGIWLLLLLMPGQSPDLSAQSRSNRGIIVRELSLHKEITAIETDHHGFLWVGTSAGLYRYDGYEFTAIGSGLLEGLKIDNLAVRFLYEDQYHHLWITCSKGIFILSADRRHLVPITPVPNIPFPSATGPKSDEINVFEFGKEVYVTNFSPYLHRYRFIGDSMYVLQESIRTPLESALHLVPLKDGRIIVQTHTLEEVVFLSTDHHTIGEKLDIPNSHLFQTADQKQLLAFTFETMAHVDTTSFRFSNPSPLGNLFSRPMRFSVQPSARKVNNIWIGGQFGELVLYNCATQQFVDYSQVVADRLFDGRYFSINTTHEDKSGGLWIGTNIGLAYVRLGNDEYFNLLPLPPAVKRNPYFSTRGITEMDDGRILVGTYDGIFFYTPETTSTRPRKWKDVHKFFDEVGYTFLPDSNKLWIGNEGGGVQGFIRDDLSPDGWRFWQQRYQSILPGDNSGYVFTLLKDHAGAIWAGTGRGLISIEPESGEHHKIKGLAEQSNSLKRITALTEDENHRIWIGSTTGLYTLSADRKSIDKHPIEVLNTPAIQALLISEPYVWVGTRGSGLVRYEINTAEAKIYNTNEGLADNVICAIQEGNDGSLWISTHLGLSRFDPKAELFTNFYMTDGLPDNEFNHGSSFKARDGTLYFGGINGVVCFDPMNEVFQQKSNLIRVSKVVRQNGKTGRNEEILYSANEPVSISLGYRDQYFAVSFSLDDPTPQPPGAYTYKLEGFHSDWQNNGNSNTVSFTGLQPGDYTLLIKTLSQAEKKKSMLSIPVYIARPFYKTWWAYASYLLLFGLIAFLIIRAYFSRLHMHKQLQLEIDHKARLQEINRSKSTFFTNITHEFKTPLTLIQGPAEEIARHSSDPKITKQANLIKKSAQSILTLVNQLLDLGKLEANLEEPQFHRLDLVHHVQGWMDKFITLARQKEIKLGFETEQTALYVDFDPVKFETVINNLLSNAIKFTPEKGIVKCSIKSPGAKTVQIIVSDNGPGIAKEEQDFVFDRFYQGKNSVLGGTGIGLAFVREMVRIHSGTVILDSTPGEGATFTVTLPVYQHGALQLESPDVLQEEKLMHREHEQIPESVNGNSEKPVILVVEDNIDVATLILDVIGTEYQVLHAPNGRDGHQVAIAQVPDIVITDVMMPVMDGYSFTHLIKQDLHTCHIPVIMLTAKDGEQSRIEGRSSGADVYLQKPFSIKELQLTVRNLLNLKAKLAQRATHQLEKNAGEVEFASDGDSGFYKNFLRVLEENLSESSLSVDHFTSSLAVSRTQLHRKLKAITGLSVNQIVRNVRLQKGMSLIREGKMTIAEIAYEVGFSNPAYFTERFKEYYGYPPSEADRNPVPGPSA